MLRGKRIFVCDECGHKFWGMDFEWNATTLSQPLKCPKCGSWHTRPVSIFGLNKSIYKEIWKQMDKIRNADDDKK
jgi:DNA-directed RNA polymerase subunit RPC12/RpoP